MNLKNKELLKNKNIQLKVTISEYEAMRSAASTDNRSLSDFIRLTVLKVIGYDFNFKK